MSITEFHYLIFLTATVLLYYALPKKVRWIGILISDFYFILRGNSIREFACWLGMALFTYVISMLADKMPGEKSQKAITVLGVIILAGVMILLKDSSFFGLPQLGISPMGISYYTLSWIAYLLEAYYHTGPLQKNPFKFLAFAGFFPLLTSGPIVRYKDVGESIASELPFSIDNITNGAARILWGFMKKLIIADRIAIFIDTVYLNPYRYPGLFFHIANAFFVIQLYADFSGCIDIALGSAEMLGIKLPENFDLPFLSQTLEEFWRRWHITLGGWLKDFILYPILKSPLFQAIGSASKKLFGKKTGKKIPVWIALLISWFLVGFWHGGGWNYIFGVGLLFGAIIILGQILEPVFKWIIKLLHINDEALSWKGFRIVRTWFFFGTGLSFFRAGSLMAGFRNLKLAYTSYNPWILFTGELYELGLDRTDFNILIFFLALVAITGIVRFRTGASIRSLMAKQNLLFRWLAYALLIYAVIIYGCYGVGFHSASFIYQGF